LRKCSNGGRPDERRRAPTNLGCDCRRPRRTDGGAPRRRATTRAFARRRRGRWNRRRRTCANKRFHRPSYDDVAACEIAGSVGPGLERCELGRRRIARARMARGDGVRTATSTREAASGLSSKIWPGEPGHCMFACVVRRFYAAPERSCPLIGNARSRLPVAAKIAFVTAGWIMVAPGSPTPPHLLPGVGVM
jgi:hypothetical protein